MAFNSLLSSVRYRHMQAQPDEGYSEETQSLPGSDMDTSKSVKLSDTAKTVLRSLEALPVDERLDILRLVTGGVAHEDQLVLVRDLLYSLPTWAKQHVSHHLDALMFFDPINYFPYEIIQNIFSELSPKDLLNASVVSRQWRERTQDEELWRTCFRREGWKVDMTKIRSFEQTAREKGERYASGLESLGRKQMQRKDSRKRRREEAFSEVDSTTLPANIDSRTVEGDADRMEGIERTPVPQLASASASAAAAFSPTSLQPESPIAERRRSSLDSIASFTPTTHGTFEDMDFKLKPTLLQSRGATGSDATKVSWAYLYKQRRLLERNWDNGRYQMFRLPHPKHEEEGHAECVYTIQHIGSILVSGSRDRTIRRWDLETCRLKGLPLHGHEASVLCLQFDPSPENDIIVSGGSDSWVIIWRYSTGKIIKKMTTAHAESVLNLRFDDRYIVTCSKDKTIKIWNRKQLAQDDPMLPDHVVPQLLDATAGSMIKEYSLLTMLFGHQAAVNAVMIHANRIVSASGDRVIKAWNIKTGKCEKTYTGHTKGIACVQYDGRRIVSGSSDNSVRIFDAEQQAEVACLTGHSNLVRTVQARFGDLDIRSDQELEEEARRADHEWRKAMDLGVQPASASRRGKRNAGSSRPQDVLTLGARVPHGGGGSKWARIVSGSYDETVIIWKKDHDGKWTARHRLQQDMLLRTRVRNMRQTIHPANAPGAINPHAPQLPPGSRPPPPQQQQQQQQQIVQQTVQQTSHPAVNIQTITTQHATGSVPVNASNQHQQQIVQTAGTHTNTATTTTTHTHTQAQQPNGGGQNTVVTSTQQLATNQPAPQNQQAVQPAQHHPPAQQAVHVASTELPHQHPPRESNRVFKLQFDTRRIVCCSQNKVIVGWDFACGNEELERVGNWCEETY